MAGGVRRGIVPRIFESWIAPRRVVRGLRGMPDAALTVVLLAAMLVFLLAQAPMHAREATLDTSVSLGARLSGAALAVMFLMPLVAYAVAQLTALASRLTPWRISSEDSRLALFWALLASSPAMLLAGLTAGLVGPSAALTLTRAIAGTGFLVIWAAGIAALSVRR